MDVGLFRRIVDQFATSPHQVYLCGLGEPLMHRQLNEMIAYCVARGMRGTVIHTNGTMLTPDRVDGLASAGLSEVRLSIDGGDAATLSRARPGVRLSLLTSRMQYLTCNTTIKASLYFTANRENLHSLPSLVDVAVDMGVGQIHVVDTVPFGAGDGFVAVWATRTRKLSAVSDGWKEQIMLSFRRRCADAGIEAIESLESFRPSCRDPFGKIYVTWKGEVTPCCRIHKQVVVGDFRSETLPRLWHGEAMEAWRARLFSPEPPALCRQFCNLPPQLAAADPVRAQSRAS